MSITIATLQQHIKDRRAVILDIKRIDIGRGFYIEAVNLDLFIGHVDGPDDRARCGRVDAMHDGSWLLDREWRVELLATFGTLPANMAIEGEEDE
ncbi:MAG: hypothetical protein JXB07_18785 [Anaerolineae bacterium]|nr:hypothetical protein [Anaerolineae bacterium]